MNILYIILLGVKCCTQNPLVKNKFPKLILIILPINSQYLKRGKIYGLLDVRYHRDSKNLLNYESRSE